MPATRDCKPIRLFTFFFFFLPVKPQTDSIPSSLEAELSRLNRNKERRFAREKQKGAFRGSTGDSPAEGGGSGKPAGTQRKCANCGQVGHIKTNKKCVFAVPLSLSSLPFCLLYGKIQYDETLMLTYSSC